MLSNSVYRARCSRRRGTALGMMLRRRWSLTNVLVVSRLGPSRNRVRSRPHHDLRHLDTYGVRGFQLLPWIRAPGDHI